MNSLEASVARSEGLRDIFFEAFEILHISHVVLINLFWRLG